MITHKSSMWLRRLAMFRDAIEKPFNFGMAPRLFNHSVLLPSVTGWECEFVGVLVFKWGSFVEVLDQ